MSGLARVYWMTRTGETGRGSPRPLAEALAWAEAGERLYRGQVRHWVEMVEDGADETADATPKKRAD